MPSLTETLHPTPSTPYTLHPTPYTLHPTPYTLRLTPYILNHKHTNTEYKGSSTKLLWQCRNGHEFWLAPNNVRRAPGSRRKPSWCPTCGPKRGPKPSSRPPPPPQKPPRLSSRGKVLGRPRGSTKQKNAERRRSKETEVLGKSLVRGGVADALKSKSVTPPTPSSPPL